MLTYADAILNNSQHKWRPIIGCLCPMEAHIFRTFSVDYYCLLCKSYQSTWKI